MGRVVAAVVAEGRLNRLKGGRNQLPVEDPLSQQCLSRLVVLRVTFKCSLELVHSAGDGSPNSFLGHRLLLRDASWSDSRTLRGADAAKSKGWDLAECLW